MTPSATRSPHRPSGRRRGDRAGAEEQHDALTLVSLPGVGRTILATLLAEAWEPLQRRDHAALLSLTGVAPVTKRSAKVASSCVGKLARTASPTPSTTGRVSPCSAILEPAANTSNFGSRGSLTAEPRDPSQTACSSRLRHAQIWRHLSTPRASKSRLINGGPPPGPLETATT